MFDLFKPREERLKADVLKRDMDKNTQESEKSKKQTKTLIFYFGMDWMKMGGNDQYEE